MKVLKFNENEENIYIYYKIYGDGKFPVGDIFKDLNKFDKNKIKYDIFLTKNEGFGVFAQVHGNLPLFNIPTNYAESSLYDSVSKIEAAKENNKNWITKEELEIYLNANKFNI